MGPALSCLFNRHNERAMPDRRVGNRRQFQALYCFAYSTEFLLVTCRNARPVGRSGIARRAARLIPGEERKYDGLIKAHPAIACQFQGLPLKKACFVQENLV